MTAQKVSPNLAGQIQTRNRQRLFSPLYIKHLLATSAVAAPISKLRSLWKSRQLTRHPELGILFQEDRMMETLLEQLVQQDWNCLDVGAHLGSVSYLLSRLAPQGHLSMVEASPNKATWLRDRFPEADVYPVAVSDSDGETSFYENLDEPGFSSLASRKSRGRVREISVPACRMDTLIGSEQHIDLIKIDVEGFEYEALKGARNLLKRCHPAILFEAGAVNDSDVDSTKYDALFSMLRDEFGYRIFAAFDLFHRRPAISADTFKSYRTYPYLAFNYFALSPERAYALTQRES
jgi:FkbM family methyltransferase